MNNYINKKLNYFNCSNAVLRDLKQKNRKLKNLPKLMVQLYYENFLMLGDQ